MKLIRPHLAASLALAFVWSILAAAATSAQSDVRGNDEQRGGVPRAESETSSTFPDGRIDSMIRKSIDDGQMAGAVVAVADRRESLFAKAYGHRQVEPSRIAMTCETVFDLASLTKPVATASSVMVLVEAGEIDLDAPVARYLPEFARRGKAEITVTDLLLHQSGLIADNSLDDYADGPASAWRRICGLKPIAAAGEKFIYSDVGFIVLGKLVERVSGRPLSEFSQAMLYQPLGMDETMFNPPERLRRRAAATEQRDGQWMVGQVHDPRAHRLGGVAGHAGLFSTADDLIRFGQMLLEQSTADGVAGSGSVLSPATVDQMVTPRRIARGLRGLGWDVQSPYSSNRGKAFSKSAFGHGGFTGTVLWIDPEQEIVFVFLSNRLHPDGEGSVNRLAGRIATLVAEHVVRNADSTP